MKVEWLTIGKHRHLCVDGKALCEKFGGYTKEWANPCGSCLNIIRNIFSEAFMERDYETAQANTSLD